MAAITGIHVVAPKEAHQYTMIFLHGRDDDPELFPESVLESETSTPKRSLPEVFPSMKWVFPASRSRESMRFKCDMIQVSALRYRLLSSDLLIFGQWFDIWSVEDPSEKEHIQLDGLRESVSAIIETIYEEARIVPLCNIFLGGISQGSATAILALLCSNVKLGGFVGLCTWIPFRSTIIRAAKTYEQGAREEAASNAASADIEGELVPCASSQSKSSYIGEKVRALLSVPKQNTLGEEQTLGPSTSTTDTLATPVFLSHSQNDEIVPIQNGRLLKDCLKSLGMEVIGKEYDDGGHWIYEPEDESVRNGIDDIEEFIRRSWSQN